MHFKQMACQGSRSTTNSSIIKHGTGPLRARLLLDSPFKGLEHASGDLLVSGPRREPEEADVGVSPPAPSEPLERYGDPHGENHAGIPPHSPDGEVPAGPVLQ